MAIVPGFVKYSPSSRTRGGARSVAVSVTPRFISIAYLNKTDRAGKQEENGNGRDEGEGAVDLPLVGKPFIYLLKLSSFNWQVSSSDSWKRNKTCSFVSALPPSFVPSLFTIETARAENALCYH